MTAIETAVALIRQFDGCRLQAYRCPAGKWTIGYGHTADALGMWVYAGKQKLPGLVSRRQAERMVFRRDES
jgi:GH24 family phage-related lysozyme (muramidase)